MIWQDAVQKGLRANDPINRLRSSRQKQPRLGALPPFVEMGQCSGRFRANLPAGRFLICLVGYFGMTRRRVSSRCGLSLCCVPRPEKNHRIAGAAHLLPLTTNKSPHVAYIIIYRYWLCYVGNTSAGSVTVIYYVINTFVHDRNARRYRAVFCYLSRSKVCTELHSGGLGAKKR